MHRSCALFVMFLASLPAAAQAPAARQLMLRPANAPVPALKYALLPEVIDQTPGNAVQVYYRAMVPEAFAHRRQPDIDKKLEQWRNASLKDLPRAEMAWLQSYPPLRECDTAARRESCNWEMASRLRQSGFATLLPEMQPMRELASLLVLRSRLELAAGRHDQATYTFQTALALSRHLGEAPVLISNLVGVACAGMVLKEMEEFLQTPGAPNLYWSLTALPHPFIDMSLALQGEQLAFGVLFPQWRELEQRPLTPRELDQLRDSFLQIGELSGAKQAEEAARKKALEADIVRLLPEARRALLAAGRKAEEVDALPALQIVAVHAFRQYQEVFDDMKKLMRLPYWQARPALLALETQLAAQKLSALPLSQLFPAIHKAYFAGVRLDRHLAILRCIEAIRLHAAANQGKLPSTLADIVQVPMPLDPVTGKEFVYKLTADKATLLAPPPAGEQPTPTNSLSYELVLVR